MQNCLTRKVTELFKAFTLHGTYSQSKSWENFLASNFIPKSYVPLYGCYFLYDIYTYIIYSQNEQ